MFDLIDGVPLHPLVVHAIVVLLPLSVVGTIAIAVRPAWRMKYGHLVLAAEVIVTALCPVATASGEKFEARVIPSGVGRHSELGDQLVYFSGALLLFTALLYVMERRAQHAPEPDRVATARGAVALPNVVAVLAVVAAVAAGIQVYRVGDSGAHAAWGFAGQIKPK